MSGTGDTAASTVVGVRLRVNARFAAKLLTYRARAQAPLAGCPAGTDSATCSAVLAVQASVRAGATAERGPESARANTTRALLPLQTLDATSATVKAVRLRLDTTFVAIFLSLGAGTRAAIAHRHAAALSFSAGLPRLTNHAASPAVLSIGTDVDTTRTASGPSRGACLHTSPSPALHAVRTGNPTGSAIVVVRVQVSALLCPQSRRTNRAATGGATDAPVTKLSDLARERAPATIQRIAHAELTHPAAISLSVRAIPDARASFTILPGRTSASTRAAVKWIGKCRYASTPAIDRSGNTPHGLWRTPSRRTSATFVLIPPTKKATTRQQQRKPDKTHGRKQAFCAARFDRSGCGTRRKCFHLQMDPDSGNVTLALPQGTRISPTGAQGKT